MERTTNVEQTFLSIFPEYVVTLEEENGESEQRSLRAGVLLRSEVQVENAKQEVVKRRSLLLHEMETEFGQSHFVAAALEEADSEEKRLVETATGVRSVQVQQVLSRPIVSHESGHEMEQTPRLIRIVAFGEEQVLGRVVDSRRLEFDSQFGREQVQVSGPFWVHVVLGSHHHNVQHVILSVQSQSE